MSQKTHKYTVGERILASNKGVQFFFDARVVEVIDKNDGRGIMVHYQGWAKRYDEFIPEEEIKDRTMPYSEEEHQKAKALYNEAKKSKNRKKNKVRTPDEGEEDGKSRDTSPSQQNDEDSTVKSETSTKNLKRPHKRKYEDSVDMEKDTNIGMPEFRLSLPNSLKQALTEDYDLINRQMKLYSLPAKITIDKIILDYINDLNLTKKDNDEVLIEYNEGQSIKQPATDVIQSAHGLQDYFEALLPMQLLYKFEREQYNKILEKQKKGTSESSNKKSRRSAAKETTVEIPAFKASTVYGLPHLLRLITRFENYVKVSGYTERVRKGILSVVCDFVVWLNKNCDKYYNPIEDYEVGSPEYQREAFI